MLSLIVLNYNKEEYSRRCLESLLETEHRPLEVIAVDNGSTDGTATLLASLEPLFLERGIGFRRLVFDSNRGAIVGRNRAFDLARGDRIAFLDNDVTACDGSWAGPLLEALEEGEEVGIVGPRLLFPEPERRIQCAGCAVSRDGRVVYLGRGEPRDDPRFACRREVQCLISACIVVKRSLLEDVGLFDEAFSPVQFEDIDLCYRARQAGYRILYIPESELFHYEGVTTDGSEDLNFAYLTVRNGMIFKTRWRHVFEVEDGPSRAPEWRSLTRPRCGE